MASDTDTTLNSCHGCSETQACFCKVKILLRTKTIVDDGPTLFKQDSLYQESNSEKIENRPEYEQVVYIPKNVASPALIRTYSRKEPVEFWNKKVDSLYQESNSQKVGNRPEYEQVVYIPKNVASPALIRTFSRKEPVEFWNKKVDGDEDRIIDEIEIKDEPFPEFMDGNEETNSNVLCKENIKEDSDEDYIVDEIEIKNDPFPEFEDDKEKTNLVPSCDEINKETLEENSDEDYIIDEIEIEDNPLPKIEEDKEKTNLVPSCEDKEKTNLVPSCEDREKTNLVPSCEDREKKNLVPSYEDKQKTNLVPSCNKLYKKRIKEKNMFIESKDVENTSLGEQVGCTRKSVVATPRSIRTYSRKVPVKLWDKKMENNDVNIFDDIEVKDDTLPKLKNNKKKKNLVTKSQEVIKQKSLSLESNSQEIQNISEVEQVDVIPSITPLSIQTCSKNVPIESSDINTKSLSIESNSQEVQNISEVEQVDVIPSSITPLSIQTCSRNVPLESSDINMKSLSLESNSQEVQNISEVQQVDVIPISITPLSIQTCSSNVPLESSDIIMKSLSIESKSQEVQNISEVDQVDVIPSSITPLSIQTCSSNVPIESSEINTESNTDSIISEIEIKDDPFPGFKDEKTVVTNSDELNEGNIQEKSHRSIEIIYQDIYNTSVADQDNITAKSFVAPASVRTYSRNVPVEIWNNNRKTNIFEDVPEIIEPPNNGPVKIINVYKFQEGEFKLVKSIVKPGNNRKIKQNKMIKKPSARNITKQKIKIIKVPVTSNPPQKTEENTVIRPKLVNGKLKFPCDKCKKTYVQKTQLLKHVVLHSCEKKPNCPICDKQFENELSFRRHKRTHKSKKSAKKYLCEICGRWYLPQYFAKHKIIHSLPHLEMLQNRIKIRKTLQNKVKVKKIKQKIFKCKFCERLFDCRGQLRRHENIHSGIKNYLCKFCGLAFYYKLALFRHESVFHLKYRPFICSICGTSFCSADKLKIHELLHSNIKKFHCNMCAKSFISKRYLDSHKRNLHKSVPVYKNRTCHACKICGKKYVRLASVVEHEKLHLPHDKLVCETCKKSYSTHHALSCHKRFCDAPKKDNKMHSKKTDSNELFNCLTCGKSCPSQFTLMHHLCKNTENNPNPFVCNICCKYFSSGFALKRHNKNHEKKFKCNYCGKLFSYKVSLTIHTRIHTGHKPYVCDVCGKSFNQKEHLKLHKRIESGLRPFSCDICGGSFSTKGGLREHMVIHLRKR